MLWCLSDGFERLVYEASKTTYDLYGVAVSRDGDVYVSCPYAGEGLRLGWLPVGNVNVVLDPGFEKRILSLSLDKSLVERARDARLTLTSCLRGSLTWRRLRS